MAGGRGPKSKGDRFELELAAYFNTWVFNGHDQVTRAIMSGSMGRGTGKGVGGSDLNGLPMLFVEAKRCETLRPQWSISQAETNARLRKTQDFPVVVSRKSHQTTGESVVIMRLEDFTIIYRHAMERLGYVRERGREGGD